MAYQPYWLAYCRALRLEPDDGIPSKFALWIRLRWLEWYRANDLDPDKPTTRRQREAFGRWLKSRAEILRGRSPLYHLAEEACHGLRQRRGLREWAGRTLEDGHSFRNHMSKSLRRRGASSGDDGVRFKESWSHIPERLVWLHPESRTILTFDRRTVIVSKINKQNWEPVVRYLETFYANAS